MQNGHCESHKESTQATLSLDPTRAVFVVSCWVSSILNVAKTVTFESLLNQSISNNVTGVNHSSVAAHGRVLTTFPFRLPR